jgi:hypothetical protein
MLMPVVLLRHYNPAVVRYAQALPTSSFATLPVLL